MRNFFLLLLLVVLPEISAAQSCGSSNGAYIPSTISGSGSSAYEGYTFISISNISADTVTVSLKLYEPSGTLVTDDNSSTSGAISAVGSFSNYGESGGVTTFNLAANSTIGIRYDRGTALTVIGHGRIEWSSTSVPVGGAALVAHAHHYVDQLGSATKQSRISFPINGGLPF